LPVGTFLTYVALGTWSVVCLLPLYWVAVTTLKQPINIISGARYLPWIDFKPTLDAWAFILFNPTDDTLGRYLNSIFVAFASTGFTIFLGSLAAFGDRLRAMHDDIVRQGIPDRFADLLSQLDKSAKGVQPKTIA